MAEATTGDLDAGVQAETQSHAEGVAPTGVSIERPTENGSQAACKSEAYPPPTLEQQRNQRELQATVTPMTTQPPSKPTTTGLWVATCRTGPDGSRPASGSGAGRQPHHDCVGSSAPRHTAFFQVVAPSKPDLRRLSGLDP